MKGSKKIAMANIKGDDHKTKGRIGNRQTLEFSRWGGISVGITATFASYGCWVLYEEDIDPIPARIL